MNSQDLLTDAEKLKCFVHLKDYLAAPIVIAGAVVAAEVAGLAVGQAVVAVCAKKALMSNMKKVVTDEEVQNSIDKLASVGGIVSTGVTTIVVTNAAAAAAGGGPAVASLLTSCGSFGVLSGSVALAAGSMMLLAVIAIASVVAGGYAGLKLSTCIKRVFQSKKKEAK